MKKFFSSLLLGTLLLSTVAFAYTGNIAVVDSSINFSSNNILEGNLVRIYASTKNDSSQDLLGVVRFFDNGNQIGSDQAISLFGGKTDDIFVDWVPLAPGDHQIAVKLYPYNSDIDDPSDNWATRDVFVVQDTDHDGIQNSEDPDDDNDGVPDEEDEFPLNNNEQYDTDGDGIGDNADEDADNDGVPDESDDLPTDPNETTDTDRDGIGNIADTDDDGDSLSDNEEDKIGTDSLDPDTDKDSYNDGEDAFPLAPEEWYDTDEDGIGNNTDIDDDNDGIQDETDQYPLNKGPVIDLGGDNFIVPLLEEYVFDASDSYDEDGSIVTYLWNINGEVFEGNSIIHTFTKTGEYDVSLTVIDDDGESRTANFLVDVLNLRLYFQLAATLIAILLALLIYFKYIARTKNDK